MTDLQKMICTASLLLAACGAAQAEGKLYRWTDSKGAIHFGDQPAPNAQEVSLKLLLPGGKVVPPAASTPAVAASECESKKNQLASYRGAARITETNALGETREYNEEQRARLIEATEQAVHAACEPA